MHGERGCAGAVGNGNLAAGGFAWSWITVAGLLSPVLRQLVVDVVQTNLGMALDEDGFFGRECPNADCLGYFKLAVDEYGMARERHRLTCPACGTTESDEHFFTSDQLERIRAAQIEFARGAVNDVFRDLGRRGTSRSGAVTIKWNTPTPFDPKPLPAYVERQTIRTFTCPNGGHRAVVYDLLALCPYCGPDDTPPWAVFDDTMAAMARLMRVVTEQPREARAELEAAGGSTVQAERALTIGIAAIQNLAKQIHIRAAKPKPSGNPCQNVDRLAKLWLADFGADPLAALSTTEQRTLRLGFARRHILEHNGGVADVKYVRETGDGPEGRRVRFAPTFVTDTFATAQRLADALST